MTKKLIALFIILLVTYSGILIYTNFDKILDYIEDKHYENKISDIIPEGNEYERKYNYSTFKITDSATIYNKDDIISLFYTILNKGASDFTFYCPKEYTECAEDVIEISNSDAYLSLINNYLSPFNSYNTFYTTVINHREILVEIDYFYDEEEKKSLNLKINDVMNKLKLNKDSYNVDDIKRVHDYLIDNITYDEEYKMKDGVTASSKATGALLSGMSVCGGYADSFALFMDKMNIPNFKVTSAEHIWNVILLDGKWTHVDVTWDDDENNPSNSTNFFMITSKELTDLNTNEHDYDINDYLELRKK